MVVQKKMKNLNVELIVRGPCSDACHVESELRGCFAKHREHISCISTSWKPIFPTSWGCSDGLAGYLWGSMAAAYASWRLKVAGGFGGSLRCRRMWKGSR